MSVTQTTKPNKKYPKKSTRLAVLKRARDIFPEFVYNGQAVRMA